MLLKFRQDRFETVKALQGAGELYITRNQLVSLLQLCTYGISLPYPDLKRNILATNDGVFPKMLKSTVTALKKIEAYSQRFTHTYIITDLYQDLEDSFLSVLRQLQFSST